MNNTRLTAATVLLFAGLTALLAGCADTKTDPAVKPPQESAAPSAGGSASADSHTSTHLQDTRNDRTDDNAIKVTANPSDITVLVNKQIMLPDGYKPSDLVEPKVPFIFQEKDERRLLRKEAAEALEAMIAGARNDGIYLAGVSGYRSYETQKTLYDYYVKVQGQEEARKYSAEPGHSEHQTGLAMDVSGSTGKCAAADCFADTSEAKWLASHSSEYGFIIRYMKGKEDVTGYNYEPWHLRYVGIPMAREITDKGIALEEYDQNARPVSK